METSPFEVTGLLERIFFTECALSFFNVTLFRGKVHEKSSASLLHGSRPSGPSGAHVRPCGPHRPIWIPYGIVMYGLMALPYMALLYMTLPYMALMEIDLENKTQISTKDAPKLTDPRSTRGLRGRSMSGPIHAKLILFSDPFEA